MGAGLRDGGEYETVLVGDDHAADRDEVCA
jgi:hypothetical protein